MRIKLRTKLLVLVLVSIFISLGTAIPPLILIFQNAQRSATLEGQAQIAEAAAEEISHFLDSQFLILNEAELLLFPGLLQDEIFRKTFMQRLLFRSDVFFDIVLVDPNGKELARENRYRVIKPPDLGNRSQSQEFQITKDQGYYLGPLYFEGGQPLFKLGQAVKDVEGRLISIVIAEVDARIMQEVVRQTTVARVGGRSFIVNREGIIVAHPNFSEVLAQKDFSSLFIVSALKQNKSFSSIYKNETNEEVLGAWASITVNVNDEDVATEWYIIAEESVSYALRHVNRALWFGLWSLFFGFTLTVIGVWFFSRRIVRPIEIVHQAVIQFGKGKFVEHVSVNTGDEIKDLADGFNQMAEKITTYTNALKKERDQTAAIVASLGDGLIMYDPQKKIIFLNPMAQEMLLVSSQQVLGKFLKNKNAFTEPLLKNFYNISTLPLKSWETKEYTIESPNKVVLQVTHVGLRGPKGRKLGSMRVLHNITREKEVEAMKSEFVSLASHQLRSPLSGIKWSLDLLLEGEFGKLGAEQKEIIKGAFYENNRAIEVVNDLLEISRIEAGQFGYSFSLGSIESLVSTLLKRFHRQIQEKKLQLFYEKPKASLPKINIDSEKLEMAIQNVVDNAVKYTLKGGKIEIYFRKSATHLDLIVRDTGIGIPKAQQSRVFDKFFRAGNAIRLQTVGSGFGLFIAKNIIKAHGGKIDFVSEENKGSEFRISLPIDPKLIPKGKKQS